METTANRLPPVSIVTVTRDTYFFVRLLVEKVREFVGAREYELIVVDRGSRDGSVEWLRQQTDVQLCTVRQWRRTRHGHGEAAMHGLHRARHERVVLLDSDAHPVAPHWLEATTDRLVGPWRLAGPEFHKRHADGSYTRYVHPHFMAFLKEDLGTERETGGAITRATYLEPVQALLRRTYGLDY